MINGPGKYSVNIATPGVTIRGTDGAPPVRCMMALAEQISELDSIVIYGRVVGVRLVMERALPSAGAIRPSMCCNRCRAPCRVRPIRPISQCSRERARSWRSMRTWRSIRLGAYRAGTGPEVDEAIRLHKPLEAFLAQGKEEATSLAEGYRRLAEIVAASETER
jgi:flagellum-specific ATP synthase